MPHVTVERQINAPIESVFASIAEPSNFAEAVPAIARIEFLSEQKSGVGTRFKETRVMRGKEAATELEITELAPNEHVRIVSDTHGTVWDTIFTVQPIDGGTHLRMVMEARGYKLVSKVMNPLICKLIGRFVEGDMDAIKTYCESASSS